MRIIQILILGYIIGLWYYIYLNPIKIKTDININDEYSIYRKIGFVIGVALWPIWLLKGLVSGGE